MHQHPLVIGNWKLNPITLHEADTLAAILCRKERVSRITTVAIAPPFPFLIPLKKRTEKTDVCLAAQDGFYEASGAFTGMVSMAQLASIGVAYVIIGHSERRRQGECDADVVKKVLSAHAARLIPVVCIGEQVRDSNGDFYIFVEQQLRALVDGMKPAQLKKTVIAYEPIWAIGTGVNASPDDVKEMQLFIMTTLTKLTDRATAKKVVLIYGGSVKPENAASLHRSGGMNGFLVGGASLSAESFLAIVAATR
jgi:triosephosphate isomerase